MRRALALVPYLAAWIGASAPAAYLYTMNGRPIWLALVLGAVVPLGLGGYHLTHLALGRTLRTRDERAEARQLGGPRFRDRADSDDEIGDEDWTAEDMDLRDGPGTWTGSRPGQAGRDIPTEYDDPRMDPPTRPTRRHSLRRTQED